MTTAKKLYETLLDQWKSGKNAELKLICENGRLKVTLYADLGPWAQPEGLRTPSFGNEGLHKVSPGRLRRRERRAAERAAAEQAAAKYAATLKAAAEEADAAAAEEVCSSKIDAGKAAAKKVDVKKAAAAEKVDVENDAKKAAAEECSAEKAAAVKADVVVIVETAAVKEVDEVELATTENAASTSCLGRGKSAKVQTSCLNCDVVMTPDHQCNSTPEVVEEQQPPLPLCHYCCHRGSGKYPVHYFLQCVCDDWPCTCWCYCTDAQLEHKQLVFPAGFGLPGYKMKTVNAEDRPKASALAEARTGKARPCDNPSCMEDFEKDNARALGQM